MLESGVYEVSKSSKHYPNFRKLSYGLVMPICEKGNELYYGLSLHIEYTHSGIDRSQILLVKFYFPVSGTNTVYFYWNKLKIRPRDNSNLFSKTFNLLKKRADDFGWPVERLHQSHGLFNTKVMTTIEQDKLLETVSF